MRKCDVAPVVGVLGVALPLVGDADAAGEADAPVDHQQLAVGAVVHAAEVVPVQRVVALARSTPASRHRVEQVARPSAAAGPVEHDIDLDAGARALDSASANCLPMSPDQ